MLDLVFLVEIHVELNSKVKVGVLEITKCAICFWSLSFLVAVAEVSARVPRFLFLAAAVVKLPEIMSAAK